MLMEVGEGGPRAPVAKPTPSLTHHAHVSLPLVHLSQLSETFSLKIGLFWSFCCDKLQLLTSLLVKKNSS